jgi:tRNA C32,U32 (ribose-2'-O)-methylase TrmJ
MKSKPMYKIINIAEWVGVWLYLIAATWLVAVTREEKKRACPEISVCQ